MAMLLGPAGIEGRQMVCAAIQLALELNLCQLQNVAQPQRGRVEHISVLRSLGPQMHSTCLSCGPCTWELAAK